LSDRSRDIRWSSVTRQADLINAPELTRAEAALAAQNGSVA
jgi:hypothetical protein